jgi:serine/threonine protein kinase
MSNEGADPHPLLPFSRIAAYEIDRLLGRGSMASVYACHHTRDRRLAAVKIMHPHLAGDRVASARFARESRVLSKVIHPNVVEVLDVGAHEGVPYFAMSLVEGDELADHMRRLHPMSMIQIADCMLPVIDAVSAAHDVGVVHRDLKPRNIRVVRDLRGNLVPTVLDFGISKLKEDVSADLTDTGAALGTLNYMSPEQLRSAKCVDARTDVYALGVILYECATGARPFHGDSTYYLMHAILTACVAPPSVYRSDIPSTFDALVLRAMAREPSERFGSARELWSALASVGLRAHGGHSYASSKTPTMLFMTMGRVVVFVNRTVSPTDKEWNSYLEAGFRVRSRHGPPRVLAVSEGGPPSAKQRKAGVDVAKAVQSRSAVVTDEPVARAIVTAFRWLGNDVRAFSSREMARAIDFLDLSHRG